MRDLVSKEVPRGRKQEASHDGPSRSFPSGIFWPTLCETFSRNDMKNH